MLAVVDADVVNGHDVRMLEKSGRRNLAPKPLDDLLARERSGQNHLHRDDPPEAGLPRAINHTHSAAGYFFEQFVIAEVATAGRRRRGNSGGTGCVHRLAWDRTLAVGKVGFSG